MWMTSNRTRSAPRRNRPRDPARTWHEYRAARESSARGSPGARRTAAAALRELRQRGEPALLRRLRSAARCARALAVALLADRHRGPHARGLAGVAHAVGAAGQARASHA